MKSLRDLYLNTLSDLGMTDEPSVQKETGETATSEFQHELQDTSKDKARPRISPHVPKPGQKEQSTPSTDNNWSHAQMSKLDSRNSCQVTTYPKDWKYHFGQTWDQVYGEGKSVRHRGKRGQQTWFYKCRDTWTQLLGSYTGEKSFQNLYCQSADLGASDADGETLLMKTCARKNPVLAANILYFLGMDQVQTAIHQHDYNGMKAVHYAAAVGDVDALKVLLFPANLFDRKVNIWRLQNELLRSERMPSQRQDAEHDHSTSDYLPDSDRPPQTWLDIFKELPADFKDRVELPNITFSEWRLVRSTYYLIPEKLSSKEKNRTPLHEAVLGGSLGAVKFLLSYSGIDASIRDVDGKTAAVLALGRDHYDVYNLIINHMREKEV